MIKKTRRNSAQSIVETVVGIIFLVPIVLFLLDIAVLVMANTANDNLAKTVARAAASAKDVSTSEGTAAAGFSAATAAANTFAESGIIGKSSSGSFLTGYSWNGTGSPDSQGAAWPGSLPTPNIGDVGVVTSMKVSLPVPFPFLPSQIDFQAKAVEPIVSIAAGGAFDTGLGGGSGGQSDRRSDHGTSAHDPVNDGSDN